MNTPTYKEQFDKLTRAYIENKVKPYRDCACFVGNLLNGSKRWAESRVAVIDGELEYADCIRYEEILVCEIMKHAGGLYTPREILELEGVFMKIIWDGSTIDTLDDADEDTLFKAFEATLELLKQIHESKGEVIDESPKFTKRELQS